jgi:plastocyanin
MALTGVAMVVLPTVAGSVEPTPNITAHNEPGVYSYHSWMPSTATVSLGGVVKFSNPYTTTYHGLKFTGGTAGTTPGCTGIPQQATEPIGAFHWEGECTFSKAGTYTFVCTVHPTEMKGTITVPGTPKTKTISASGETQSEATLNGSIEPEGNVTEYRFEYGTATVSEHMTSTLSVGSTDFASHPVSAAVSGLLPNKTYHFELIATYGTGKTAVPGGEQTFTTLPVGPPTATTGEATSVTETEATLKGTVNPGGEATEYFFEYGTDTHYGQTTEKATLSASGGNQGVSAALKSLIPGTEYHFRLVAKNAVGGPIKGVDRTFKTELPPASKESPSPTTTTTTTPPSPPTTTTTTPIVELPPGPPIVGGPSLAASQHGSSVRGSLDVSAAGVGGRLEVDLLAKSASLARRGHSKQATVGRLVRSSLYAGSMSFAVPLNAKGKATLRRKRRLALSVQIVLTPLHGAAVTITRSIVLHA